MHEHSRLGTTYYGGLIIGCSFSCPVTVAQQFYRAILEVRVALRRQESIARSDSMVGMNTAA